MTVDLSFDALTTISYVMRLGCYGKNRYEDAENMENSPHSISLRLGMKIICLTENEIDRLSQPRERKKPSQKRKAKSKNTKIALKAFSYLSKNSESNEEFNSVTDSTSDIQYGNLFKPMSHGPKNSGHKTIEPEIIINNYTHMNHNSVKHTTLWRVG